MNDLHRRLLALAAKKGCTIDPRAAEVFEKATGLLLVEEAGRVRAGWGTQTGANYEGNGNGGGHRPDTCRMAADLAPVMIARAGGQQRCELSLADLMDAAEALGYRALRGDGRVIMDGQSAPGERA